MKSQEGGIQDTLLPVEGGVANVEHVPPVLHQLLDHLDSIGVFAFPEELPFGVSYSLLDEGEEKGSKVAEIDGSLIEEFVEELGLFQVLGG